MAERSKLFQSAALLLALTLLVFLFTAIALSFLPQDLSDIEGRKEDSTADAPARNVQRVLENAVKQDLKVTLTEAEINQSLSDQVKGEQGGFLAKSVDYKGTWVRINEGSMDVIFERQAFNRAHTISMKIEIEQLLENNNQMSSNIHWRGGRLGQMPVPQGYLLLVMSGYESLAEVMDAEVKSLKDMLRGKATIEFSDDKVTFTPRPSTTGDNLQGF